MRLPRFRTRKPVKVEIHIDGRRLAREILEHQATIQMVRESGPKITAVPPGTTIRKPPGK
jgi:hypothetical protein